MEKLNEMIKLQGQFNTLYDVEGLLAITQNYIQLRLDYFLTLFKDYEVREIDNGNYEELSVIMEGTRVICLRQLGE